MKRRINKWKKQIDFPGVKQVSKIISEEDLKINKQNETREIMREIIDRAVKLDKDVKWTEES